MLQLKDGSYGVFTDGLHSNAGTGSCVFFSENDSANIYYYHTPNDQTSYNAELTAILLAVKHSGSRPITIFSDNLECVRAFKDRERKEHPTLTVVDKALLISGGPANFEHLYSHQKEKLKRNQKKWKPKIINKTNTSKHCMMTLASSNRAMCKQI